MRLRICSAMAITVVMLCATVQEASAVVQFYPTRITNFSYSIQAGPTLTVNADLRVHSGFCRKLRYVELRRTAGDDRPTNFVASGASDTEGHVTMSVSWVNGDTYRLIVPKDRSDNGRKRCGADAKTFTPT